MTDDKIEALVDFIASLPPEEATNLLKQLFRYCISESGATTKEEDK